IRFPDVSYSACPVGGLEQMPGQYCNTVEEPLGSRIGRREVNLHRVVIELAHGDRLASHGQEVALRGMDLVVKVYAESKKHVIGVERMSVGKLRSAAQS